MNLNDVIEPSAAELHVEIVRTMPALQELAADYEHLNRATANTSPFALFDWDLAWCMHFLNLDSKIEDHMRILVVRNNEHLCVAIIPLIFSHRSIGPFKFVSGALLGADPSTTEYRNPQIETGYEISVAGALRRWLRQDRDWDWISWHGISGRLADALASTGRVPFRVEPPGHVLQLAATWEQFRAGLKRNIRESLRHCYNSLKRDGHEFEFVVAKDPDSVRGAVDRFLQLHALRAEMDGTIRHPNHFSSKVSQRFLHSICTRLAARNLLRIFQLRIGADIVAVRIAFVVNDSLYLYYSGFDPEWRRYSVMTTTVAEIIKYAIAAGFKTVNLSRGSDASKERWGPSIVDFCGAVEPRDRLSSRLAFRLYVSARTRGGLGAILLRPLSLTRRNWN